MTANITLDGAQIMAFLLASVRIVAWLVVAPPFNTRSIPVMAKVVLAVGLAMVVSGTIADDRLPTTTPELLMTALNQVLIGLSMGFVVQLLFTAISMAGAMIDNFGQFAMVAAYDPLAMTSNSVFGRFYQWIATAIMVVSGAHLIVIGGLLKTFEFLPLDGTPDFSGWQPVTMTAFRMLLTTSVQIALPLVAVLFIADLALALLTKVAPALNAMSIMFPAKIGLTLLLVGASFPMLPKVVDMLSNLSLEAMSTMSGAS
ncbi:flagellar biosynthetic protein FliR [Nocardioides sp. Kera G14]|uniref:flagellar biosynthetic protein FliR n=1 Tax=Nocardioides sp. Kera G14 TaxID=2884264 RepID=UPI001D0FDD13|nr:flagellar biosynthetic protein FliR [Nocardioides sp. Kera G14]UDY24052.1 flagellar biosynthetic protein FliR [Nocardioides sp. Kera G14]